MKKSLPLFVTLFLFITFQVYAAPPSFGAKLLPSTESDPDSFIDHKVNVISGDYCEVATDLIIKGPEVRPSWAYSKSRKHCCSSTAQRCSPV